MIRQANKFDAEAIVQMLKSYREQAPTQFLRDANNRDHIDKLLANIFAGAGFILLAEKDEQIVGMVIAAQHPDVSQVSEIAFWLDEAHRGGKLAHRLLHAYIQQCEEWKQENRIQFFSISKMNNSPDLSYDKFGFEKLEETWIK
jgi:RimJ/RimL family protein N-acetyltransferase